MKKNEKNESIPFADLLKNNTLEVFSLIFLIFSVFAQSVTYHFLSDDIPGIIENKQIKSLSYIISNPVHILSSFDIFIVNKLFGTNPAAFHMLNIIFHIGFVIVAYLFLCLHIKKHIAFIICLLFAVHPIVTESVTWISGGIYVQYGFFFFLSLLCYVRSKYNYRWYSVSILTFILSVLTEEKAFVLVLIFFVYEWSNRSLSYRWKKLLPFAAITVAYVLITFGILHVFSDRLRELESHYYSSSTTYNYFLRLPIPIGTYLQLLIWPANLSFYHEIHVYLLQYYFYVILTVLFFILWIIWFFTNRLFFFWQSFFIISILPTLTPFNIASVAAERYVYLGSIGLIVIIVSILEKFISRHKILLKEMPIIVSLLILALSVRTIVRNNDWATNETLSFATVITAPYEPRSHYNVADIYYNRGDYVRALQEYQTAINLQENFADAYLGLGNSLVKLNRYDESISYFQKAIYYNPDLWQSYQSLTEVYYELHNYMLALSYAEKTFQMKSDDPTVLTNYGTILFTLGKYDVAKQMFSRALILDPKNKSAKKWFTQYGWQQTP